MNIPHSNDLKWRNRKESVRSLYSGCGTLLPGILDVEVYKSRTWALEQVRIARADVGDEPRFRLEGEGLLQSCGGVSGEVIPSAV